MSKKKCPNDCKGGNCPSKIADRKTEDYFYCTRPLGHKGNHHAHHFGNKCLKVWRQEKKIYTLDMRKTRDIEFIFYCSMIFSFFIGSLFTTGYDLVILFSVVVLYWFVTQKQLDKIKREEMFK